MFRVNKKKIMNTTLYYGPAGCGKTENFLKLLKQDDKYILLSVNARSLREQTRNIEIANRIFTIPEWREYHRGKSIENCELLIDEIDNFFIELLGYYKVVGVSLTTRKGINEKSK